MHIEQIREFCISLKGTTEEFPFDDVTLVFKVGGKMYALLPLNKSELQINLKCNPELAIELREKYDEVTPGFHMNKKYWNTVTISSNINDELLKDWILHSYKEVIKKLPAKLRNEFIDINF